MMNSMELYGNFGLHEEELKSIISIFIAISKSDLSLMLSAFSEKDNTRITEHARAIKGAAGHLGYKPLYEAAKQVEAAAKKNDLSQMKSLLQAVGDELNKIVAFEISSEERR